MQLKNSTRMRIEVASSNVAEVAATCGRYRKEQRAGGEREWAGGKDSSAKLNISKLFYNTRHLICLKN